MEKVIIHGYTVFEDGTVLGRRGKPLKWYENGRGYLISKLHWDGKWMTKGLHTVICEAFNGERPLGYEAGHLDGDSHNNLKGNIAWLTKTDNRLQCYSDGRYVGCETNANAKLTNEKVHSICKILESGCYSSLSSLADDLGLNRSTLSHIKNGRQWVEISMQYNI